MLRNCLLFIGGVVAFLLLGIGIAGGWYYSSLIDDPELERLERASAEVNGGNSSGYGTYDSFLKQLLNAKRVFYILPPLVCSKYDKLSEHEFAEYGLSWVLTDYRKESLVTICDVPSPVSADDEENGDLPIYRHVKSLEDDEFNFGIDIAAIIWVPLKGGMAALYFVASDRSIVRKETLWLARPRIVSVR